MFAKCVRILYGNLSCCCCCQDIAPYFRCFLLLFAPHAFALVLLLCFSGREKGVRARAWALVGTIARTCAMDADVDANGVGNGNGNGQWAMLRPRPGGWLMGLEAKMDVRRARVRNVFALNYSKIYSTHSRQRRRQQKSLPKVCPCVFSLSLFVRVCV